MSQYQSPATQCGWISEQVDVEQYAQPSLLTAPTADYQFDPKLLTWKEAQLMSIDGALIRDLIITEDGRSVMKCFSMDNGRTTIPKLREACRVALETHRKWNLKHHKTVAREATAAERRDAQEAKALAKSIKDANKRAVKLQKALDKAERKRVKDFEKDRARQERAAQKQIRAVQQRIAKQQKKRKAQEDDDNATSESSNSSVVSEDSSEDSDIPLIPPPPLKRTKRVHRH